MTKVSEARALLMVPSQRPGRLVRRCSNNLTRNA